MRLHGELALLVLLCFHGGQVAEAAGNGFVRAQGTRFVINGSPYYANGFNAYWLMTMAADPEQKGKVTSVLSQAAGRGLSVARTWAFSDGGSNALQYSPGNYNENTFKGLDFVLSEARKYGVKVILSLVNNYDTFGGRKQYVDWARGQGQAIGSDDEFFTNPVVKGFYKNHVKSMDSFYANLLSGGIEGAGWDDIQNCSPVEEQNMPTQPDPVPNKSVSKRSKNFNDKEDEMLVSAWLNISMDAAQGNEQSRSTYWKRIHAFFHEHKDFVSDRSQQSLLHRWSSIQEHVNKFCQYAL